MPVTARLSKAFYDRFGEQVANELVEWFNQVDFTYRTELRELNELNFARFDAKLEQRVATLEAKFGERLAVLRSELELKFAQGLAGLREDLSDRIRDTKVSLLRWMFGFWIGTAGLILGARLAL